MSKIASGACKHGVVSMDALCEHVAVRTFSRWDSWLKLLKANENVTCLPGTITRVSLSDTEYVRPLRTSGGRVLAMV